MAYDSSTSECNPMAEIKQADPEAQALKLAEDSLIVTPCPLHPTELIAVGSEEALPSAVSADLREGVVRLLNALPRLCPRCADEGE